MEQRVKPTPHEIVRARSENPKVRERDLAAQLGITEVDLVAAQCGEGVVRIEPRVSDLLNGLEALGEVMALTRNESAVHEKIGVYDKVVTGDMNAMVLGAEIDLRIFPKLWAYGFAVEKRDSDDVRRSLQFFDDVGDAVHKIHLRPASNVDAYHALVGTLRSPEQTRALDIEPSQPVPTPLESHASVEELRHRWSRMTDVHQFFGMLKKLGLSRQQAVHMVGQDYAWPLHAGSVTAMLNHAAQDGLPIMCFVGNRGCIQIHSGRISQIKAMGPWINILDETFHMHLRTDHIAEVWGVRKPTKDGHVTSIEAYDAQGKMIIQFFGKRIEGQDERAGWRFIVENLPRQSELAA